LADFGVNNFQFKWQELYASKKHIQENFIKVLGTKKLRFELYDLK